MTNHEIQKFLIDIIRSATKEINYHLKAYESLLSKSPNRLKAAYEFKNVVSQILSIGDVIISFASKNKMKYLKGIENTSETKNLELVPHRIRKNFLNKLKELNNIYKEKLFVCTCDSDGSEKSISLRRLNNIIKHRSFPILPDLLGVVSDDPNREKVYDHAFKYFENNKLYTIYILGDMNNSVIRGTESSNVDHKTLEILTKLAKKVSIILDNLKSMCQQVN